MMNKPRAGVMAGVVLAVAALVAPETGCNPQAKAQARESASVATQFAKDVADRCGRLMRDPDTTISGKSPAVVAVRKSPFMEGQTETCRCDINNVVWDEPASNPMVCALIIGSEAPIAGGTVGKPSKQITLTADDHGLRDANHFTVEYLSADGKSTKTIKLFVTDDDCEVDGTSIDKGFCDAVRQAVVNAVDAITAVPPTRKPLGAMNEGGAEVLPAPTEPVNYGPILK